MTLKLLMVAAGLLVAAAVGIAARLWRSRLDQMTGEQVSGDWLATARGREEQPW
jgi:hypothetical protein